MAALKTTRFRADDIWDTLDDGNRYEVIDGELYVTPPPVPEHQGAVGALYEYLAPYLRNRGLGKVYVAPIGVVLDGGNGVQPDLVYVSRDRLGLISSRGIEGAPDLVVEILSPSTRAIDRNVKWRRYAAARVPHYWIVDPRTRVLEAYRLVGDDYALESRCVPGENFCPALFPDLIIPIDHLWV
ncbi:MAG: Uma2 family endonuclease [Chloroflexota bacterium]